MAIEVAYTAPDKTSFITETLQTLPETVQETDNVRRVLREAYSNEGFLQDWYAPDNLLGREAFSQGLVDSYNLGARLTMLRDDLAGKALGFARIGPASKFTESMICGSEDEANSDNGFDFEGYYLNNLAVRPRSDGSNWNKGLGSMLLHACFFANQCDPNQPVVLDTVPGNDRANAWWRRLGFVPVADMPRDSLRFDVARLSEMYYVTPNDVLLGGVMARLEQNRPWLQSARRLE